MELLLATAIGLLAAGGIYLMLRDHTFSVVLGLSLLSYAVNLFVFAAGGVRSGRAPIAGTEGPLADPLPQALVLTAIVIGLAMTAYLAALAVRAGRTRGGGDDRRHGSPGGT